MKETQHPTSKVTLEDLLRLKRAERPAPEFWSAFDAELRRKQLAAGVKNRRWWLFQVPVAFRRLWVSLPVGAAAAVALTWVALRPSAPVQTPATFVAEATPVSSPASSTPVVVASVSETSIPVDSTVVAAETPAASEASSLRVAVASSKSDPGLISDLTALMAGFNPESLAGGSKFSLQLNQGEEAAPADTFKTVAMRVESTSTEAVAPAPLDQRKARLLAYATTSLGSSHEDSKRTTRSRERVASRLSEQALQDSMSRLDVGGNHLSIKF